MDNEKIKFAVAIMNGDEEKIMGIFNTKAEADDYGKNNLVPSECGLQFCFASLFKGGKPTGDNMNIYGYYNR